MHCGAIRDSLHLGGHGKTELIRARKQAYFFVLVFLDPPKWEMDPEIARLTNQSMRGRIYTSRDKRLLQKGRSPDGEWIVRREAGMTGAAVCVRPRPVLLPAGVSPR